MNIKNQNSSWRYSSNSSVAIPQTRWYKKFAFSSFFKQWNSFSPPLDYLLQIEFDSRRIAFIKNAIIGVTCHDQITLAQTAINQGASYVAFGRFFNSSTKPNAKAAPLSLLNQACKLGVPVVAIGGITLDNAKRVIQAGASSIAVCHSLFACSDVKARAQAFSLAIGMSNEHANKITVTNT